MKSNNFILLFLLCAPLWLLAQSGQGVVTLKSDKDTVTIGDMVHLQAKVEYAARLTISGPGLKGLPESEFLEYQGSPRVTKESSENSNRKIFVEDQDVMVFLDSGWVEFPKVQYQAVLPDTTYFFESNPVKVWVEPIVAKKDIPEGLRTIIKEPTRLSDYYTWIFGLIGLLLVGALIYYLRHRKPKEVVETVPPIPIIPPVEEAVSALQKLKETRLWEEAPKGAQMQLSQILRRYLERAFKVNALEASTREINRDLKQISPTQKAILMKLLNESDMVKFAKMTMPNERQEQSIDDAIFWIKRNTQG